jgi:hypothetical protein
VSEPSGDLTEQLAQHLIAEGHTFARVTARHCFEWFDSLPFEERMKACGAEQIVVKIGRRLRTVYVESPTGETP